MRCPTFVVLCAACTAVGIVGLPTPASAAETQLGPPVLRTASDVGLPVDAETLERQYRALSSMPSVEVAYSALGPVRSIQGATGIVLSRATRDLGDGQEAREILQKFKDVLLATGSETLKIRRNDDSVVGRIIMVDQFIGDIPVLYGSVGVTLDDATGLVTSLNASFLPDRGLPRQPQIAEKDVAALAQQQLAQYGIAKPGSIKTTDTPALAYVGTHPDSTRGHLAWVVHATYTSPNGDPGNRIYWFDAIDGAIVGSDVLNKNATVKAFTGNYNISLETDDAGIESVLSLLFTAPGSTSDQDAMNAYANLVDTMAADQAQLGFVQPRPINLIVHTGLAWPNAKWTYKTIGSVTRDYLLFGDGTGFSGPFGNSRDAVAHEYGHGIAHYWFNPFGGDSSDAQPAAIGEAFGDVNAAIVDAWYRPAHQPSDPGTWTMAEVYPTNPTKGLRSLANPKSMSPLSRDWFPARSLLPAEMSAHENATIMDHAFKLMVTGGFHSRAGEPILDGNVQGNIPSLHAPAIGPEKTWEIYRLTFKNGNLGQFPTLNQVKNKAVQFATTLYGSVVADSVDRAFRAVGVGVGCTAPPAAPNLQAIHRCPKWLLKWLPVPGATIYNGEMNPTAWHWINAVPIVDGNVTQCTPVVSTEFHARVRACNGCGCSPWSNEVLMDYWPQCP
jgi:Zn-dependent metalloprotease